MIMICYSESASGVSFYEVISSRLEFLPFLYVSCFSIDGEDCRKRFNSLFFELNLIRLPLICIQLVKKNHSHCIVESGFRLFIHPLSPYPSLHLTPSLTLSSSPSFPLSHHIFKCTYLTK